MMALLPNYTWHPLGQCTAASSNKLIAAHEIMRCKSYNLWSGILSDVGEVTLITAILLTAWRCYRLWRKHTECHVATCKNHGFPVHGTPYRACHEHHPATEHADGEPITASHIATAHAKQKPLSDLAKAKARARL